MKLPTLISVFFTFAALQIVQADESPGFFLKITKNVPRLGKRSETFAMKNMKSIPRIGRSDQQPIITPLIAWLWDLDLPQPIKRRLPTNPGVEHELSVVQPVNSNTLIELLDRDAIPSEHVKFVHWKDFDRALQVDTDLYSKVIQLGRKPDQLLKQDLSFNSYIPIFSNAPNRAPSDFMLYNNNENDLYDNRFDRNFLKYNHLKK